MDNKKLFIVADKDYQPLLFEYRNIHPDFAIKFLTFDDVIDRLCFKYKDDPIPYFLKGGISYTKAKQYSKILRTTFDSDDPKITNVRKLLPNDIRVIDEYGEYELRSGNIILLEMKEDITIHHLLDQKNILYADYDLKDLDILPKIDISKALPVRLYKDKFSLYLNLFAKIRELILTNPDKKKEISIHGGKGDIYFVNMFSKLFDISVFTNTETMLLDCEDVQNTIKVLKKNRCLEFVTNDSPSLIELENLINEYKLTELDFDFAYLNLLEIVSSSKFIDYRSEKGIMYYDNFLFDPEGDIYITDFQDGDFYQVSQDNGVLSDEELSSLNINPSYINTSLEKRKKRNFLLYQNVVFLSRPLAHLSDHIYDSPFLEELGWKDNVKKIDLDNEGVFTDSAKEIFDAALLDESFYKGKVNQYHSYDHSFKGIDIDSLKKKKSWSITNLEGYISCPYKYYLSEYLPILNDDYHARWRGTLIHHIFEKIYHDDFDFEKEFNSAKECYIEQVKKDGKEMSGVEEMYLALIHDSLSMFLKSYKEIFNDSNLIENSKDYEKSIKFSLTDEDNNIYNFSGKIDKIIVSFDSSGKKYYTIVDYKSGNETFDMESCFLGQSTQLPLYAYAIMQKEPKEQYEYTLGGEFAGFAIQKSFFKSLKDAYINSEGKLKDTTLKSHFKFHGVYLNNDDFILGFDPHMFNGTKKKKSGMILNEACFTTLDADENLYNKDLESHFNLNDIIQDSINSALHAIHEIEKGHFPIKPIGKNLKSGYNENENNACTYCAYKDICYRKASDFINYKKEIIEHFESNDKKKGGSN